MDQLQDSPKKRRYRQPPPAVMGYWLAYCIYRLERYRLHPDNFDATIALVFGLLSG